MKYVHCVSLQFFSNGMYNIIYTRMQFDILSHFFI